MSDIGIKLSRFGRWWSSNGVTYTGILSPQELFGCCVLNIPQYWRRIHTVIDPENYPIPLMGGGVFVPMQLVSPKDRNRRIANLNNFCLKWTVRAQIIQPIFVGIISILTFEIFRTIWELNDLIIIFPLIGVITILSGYMLGILTDRSQ